MYLSARMNLTSNQVVSVCSLLMLLGFLFRILLGSFSYSGVVAWHYLSRFFFVSFLAMSTFKTVIRTLFILDFDRMSAIPEERMMIWMYVCTTIPVLSHLGIEAFLRNQQGLDHFGRMCLNVYLGKVWIHLYNYLFQRSNTGFSSQSATK